MSARDELAELLVNVPWRARPADQVADAILAAGYTKPRTITTADELDGLQSGVLVLTEQGGYWEAMKRRDGLNWWKEPGSRDICPSSDLTLPAQVIWDPTP